MKELIKQIFKFLIVGTLAFIIDYCFYIILINLNINYLIASFISFSLSLIFNYYASTKYVFKTITTKTVVIKFVLLSISGLILNEIILFLFEEYIFSNLYLTKIIATISVMIYNFITRKLFIER